MALYRQWSHGYHRNPDGPWIPFGHPLEQDVLAWIAAGNTLDPEFTQAELDAQAAAAAEQATRAANAAQAKADALVAALASKTPAQIDAFIVNNVTDLASAKTVLRALAQVCGVVARNLL